MKKFSDKEQRPSTVTGKVQRLRPGIVPDWAQSQQASAPQDKESLKVTGMTADASAVIIDTTQGLRQAEEILVSRGHSRAA